MMKKEITIISASSAEKKIRDIKTSPKEIAFKVGELMGDRISEKKINQKIKALIEVLIFITEEWKNLQRVLDPKE